MKNDNKGFSLIELIVVIAIMAILVGAMAPQVTKYIEKSRIASDKQAIGALFTAIQTAEADPDITGTKTLVLGGGDSAGDEYNTAIAETLGGASKAVIYNASNGGLIKLQSKSYKSAPIGVKITNGSVEIIVCVVDQTAKEKGFVVNGSGSKACDSATTSVPSGYTYTVAGGSGVNNN